MVQIKDKMGKPLNSEQIMSKGINRLKNIFLDFLLMILRWIGHIPFHSIRFVLYKFCGLRIGKGSAIHMWCSFFDPRNIIIGVDTIIGDHAFLDGRDGLIIGNHVAIASSVFIYNSQHDIHSDDFHASYGKVVIEDYVFIGPRVTILPGVHIGKAAVIAAGAVVTHDVSAFTIVAGVPANPIGKRNINQPHYKLGRARLFQ